MCALFMLRKDRVQTFVLSKVEILLCLPQKIRNFQFSLSQSALLVPGYILPLIISTERLNISNMSHGIVSRLHKALFNITVLLL